MWFIWKILGLNLNSTNLFILLKTVRAFKLKSSKLTDFIIVKRKEKNYIDKLLHHQSPLLPTDEQTSGGEPRRRFLPALDRNKCFLKIYTLSSVFWSDCYLLTPHFQKQALSCMLPGLSHKSLSPAHIFLYLLGTVLCLYAFKHLGYSPEKHLLHYAIIKTMSSHTPLHELEGTQARTLKGLCYNLDIDCLSKVHVWSTRWSIGRRVGPLLGSLGHQGCALERGCGTLVSYSSFSPYLMRWKVSN